MIPGATQATLVLTKVSPANSGIYTVEIQDTAGGNFSATGQLRVVGTPEFRLAAWLSGTNQPLVPTLSGEARRTVALEASADFTHWMPFSRMTLENAPAHFPDNSYGNQSHRFYRATLTK